MKAPQIIMIVVLAVNVWQNLEKHGETKCSEYHFGVALIAAALEVGLLYWGGFFSC